MRPIGSAASLEKRRRRAVELSKRGKGIREVARQVRASPGAVHRWLQDWKKHGDAALAAKPTPGRPSKLTAKQREKLQKLLLAGAILTETVFAYPGIGSWLFNAIQNRDFPVIEGGVLFVAIVVVVINLLVDISYAIINPRIRLARN